MINIRHNVFETNSSSTHSIAISSSSTGILDTIVPDNNGTIILTGGEFGWEWFRHKDALVKANYAAVCCCYYENSKYDDMLIEVLKEHTGAKEVIITATLDYKIGNSSYIDHESVYCGKKAFASKETLKAFIFNPLSYLETGNDNEDPSFEDEATYDDDDCSLPFSMEDDSDICNQDPCDTCWSYNNSEAFTEEHCFVAQRDKLREDIYYLSDDELATMRYVEKENLDDMYKDFSFVNDEAFAEIWAADYIFDVLYPAKRK